MCSEERTSHMTPPPVGAGGQLESPVCMMMAGDEGDESPELSPVEKHKVCRMEILPVT